MKAGDAILIRAVEPVEESKRCWNAVVREKLDKTLTLDLVILARHLAGSIALGRFRHRRFAWITSSVHSDEASKK
jgi:hypothetical protein